MLAVNLPRFISIALSRRVTNIMLGLVKLAAVHCAISFSTCYRWKQRMVLQIWMFDTEAHPNGMKVYEVWDYESYQDDNRVMRNCKSKQHKWCRCSSIGFWKDDRVFEATSMGQRTKKMKEIRCVGVHFPCLNHSNQTPSPQTAFSRHQRRVQKLDACPIPYPKQTIDQTTHAAPNLYCELSGLNNIHSPSYPSAVIVVQSEKLPRYYCTSQLLILISLTKKGPWNQASPHMYAQTVPVQVITRENNPASAVISTKFF